MSAFGGKADIAQALHAFMLIMVISAGAGPCSLDAVILGLIGKRLT